MPSRNEVIIYNTLAREKQIFTADGEVGLYVCGVTPYDTTHVGHARTYLVFDILVRHLIHRGHRVHYVQNVTDVDDSLLMRAKEVGRPYDELAAKYAAIYLEDIASLGMLPANEYPRATGAMDEMQEVITRLLAAGHAYERGGDVFLRVDSIPAFGALSRLDRTEMVRIEADQDAPTLDDPRKEDPLDILLWRTAQEGEPRWDSPWGPGRPGWHLECSTLALAHLGRQVDIHGGGSDLIYPHHECEIAQAEAVTGTRPFARYWMHVEMVRLDGRKMSKSDGNMVFARDLLKRYSADALRLYLLGTHHRQPIDYDETALKAASVTAELVADAAAMPAARGSDEVLEAEAALWRFDQALDDDLDTPRAIEALSNLAEALTSDPGAATYGARRTLRAMAARLGLQLGGSADGGR